MAQRGDVDKPAKDAQTALDEFVKEKLPGLSSADLAGCCNSVRSMDVKLRQINVNPPGTQINYSAASAWWTAASPATWAPIRWWFRW